MNKIKLDVQNMKCNGCTKCISKALSKIKGIENVNIDNDQNFIELSYESNDVLDEVKKSLKSKGYIPADDHNSLVDKANSYLHCMTGKIDNLKDSF